MKLADAPVASYRGGVQGIPATSPSETGDRKLDARSERSQRYARYLRGQHDRFIERARQQVGELQVLHRYEFVFGGVALVVPENRIDDLERMREVVFVQRDEARELLTDRSPGFIGADVGGWDATTGAGVRGEGVVVGVLDTGIWPEHPSFADPAQDSFDYPNPPSGTYDCNFGSDHPDDDPFTCNGKLLGAYRFMDAWDWWDKGPKNAPNEFRSARDNNGHGTHTASTAAGNGGVDAHFNILGRTVSTISGIAPRASVIAYKVCGGGSNGGCYASDSAAAVDQAVIDGVDVINFSISGGTDPYGDSVELAFLDAYEAGVFVAASAGNSGPNPDTVNHKGPWTATVGASTTDRRFESTVTLSASASLELTGASITNGITSATPIVKAVDFGNELCEEGKWSSTTFSGQIVVCKRGTTPRVSKSAAVAAAGGSGMLLYNVAGGDTGTVADLHSIPSIHLDVAEGEQLLDFLAANPSTSGSFPAGAANLDAQGDVMAGFSSRGGPGQTLGISKPDVTGPGVEILAGYTPKPDNSFDPQDEYFASLQGTSMSSPHVAGAAALVVDAEPSWTPGRVKSALMTTAVTEGVVKENGTTPSDPFDRGSGRIELTTAFNPGLSFDETGANFRSLQNELWNANYPSLYRPDATGTFRVDRTVRSELEADSTWTVSFPELPADLIAALEPAPEFTVPAGGEHTFTIAVNVRGVPTDAVRHARMVLTSDTGLILGFPITIVKGSDSSNTAPAADDQTVSTTEDTEVDVQLSASDPDGDALAYSIVDGPASGTLSGTAPYLTYTPGTGFSGTDSFTFEASDGAATSNVATVTIEVTASCTNDSYEPNDDATNATGLTSGTPVEGVICEGDEDWFSIEARAGDTITADLTFSHADGDLNLYLYDSEGTLLASSESTDDNESVSADVSSGGTYFLKALGSGGTTNSYTLAASTVVLSRFEESVFTFSGANWWTSSGSGMSGGSGRTTGSAGHFAQVKFTGPTVELVMLKGPSRAIAEVSIDGGPVQLVDTYSPSWTYQVVVFEVDGLQADAGHVLRVAHSGTANGAVSGSGYITIDAIDTLVP